MSKVPRASDMDTETIKKGRCCSNESTTESTIEYCVAANKQVRHTKHDTKSRILNLHCIAQIQK
jgi:hypothetical protein